MADRITVRDPEHIDAVLEEVRAFWKRHPDLRLGQVVSIAMRAVPDEEFVGVFYVEDDDLVEALRALETRPVFQETRPD